MIAFILGLVVVVAIAGALGVWALDYVRFKESNSKDIAGLTTGIASEKEDRTTEVRSVVSQVNDVNQNMHTSLTSDINDEHNRISDAIDTQTKLLNGIDSIMKFAPDVPINGFTQTPTGFVDILSLPGHAAPDVRLIKHVTLASGLNIQDVAANPANKLQICGADPSRCIKIPDDAGNVTFDALAQGKILQFNAPATMSQPLTMGDGGDTGGRIVPRGGGVLSVEAKNLGVSAGTLTGPTATLHVQGAPSGGPDVFKVSLGASDALLVDATGNVIVSQPITLKNGTSSATLSLMTDGTLGIVAPGITVNGNLAVTGTATVGGKAVQVAT